MSDTNASERSFSRRRFLQRVGAAGALGLGAGMLAACGGEQAGEAGGEGAAGDGSTFSCTDTSGLSQQAVQMRESLGYVDATPNPAQTCANCAFYQLPAEGAQCGGCQLIQGPIHPQGWCRSWAAKPSEGA